MYGYLQLNDAAVEFYDRALKIKPNDLNLIHCKSYVLCQKEDRQEGIAYIEAEFKSLSYRLQ